MQTLTIPFCLAMLALTACTKEPSFPPIDTPVPGHVQGETPATAAPPVANTVATCAGTDVLALVGQNVSKLPATGPWNAVRIIKPGMGVTMDYSPTRLNVQVDSAGKILALTCG